MEFTPVVYEHAAKFIGRTPWEVSRSADLLVEAHAAAYAVYRHTPVVAGIDVYNVEAEAYGAVVGASQGNEVPSVTGQLCRNAADVCRLCVARRGKQRPLSDGHGSGGTVEGRMPGSGSTGSSERTIFHRLRAGGFSGDSDGGANVPGYSRRGVAPSCGGSGRGVPHICLPRVSRHVLRFRGFSAHHCRGFVHERGSSGISRNDGGRPSIS